MGFTHLTDLSIDSTQIRANQVILRLFKINALDSNQIITITPSQMSDPTNQFLNNSNDDDMSCKFQSINFFEIADQMAMMSQAVKLQKLKAKSSPPIKHKSELSALNQVNPMASECKLIFKSYDLDLTFHKIVRRSPLRKHTKTGLSKPSYKIKVDTVDDYNVDNISKDQSIIISFFRLVHQEAQSCGN